MNDCIMEELRNAADAARNKLLKSAIFENFATDLIDKARRAANQGKMEVSVLIPADLQVLDCQQLMPALNARLVIPSSKRNVFRYETLSPNKLVFDWA
jgi:hypothetical protein